MKLFDLIIIGAGPSGSSAALEAARAGMENILILEQSSIPRLKSCAGGISSKAEQALKEMNLWEKMSHLIQPIDSARITYPSGKELILKGDETASVSNRRDFDYFLQQEVINSGVQLKSGYKVVNVEKENDNVLKVNAQNVRTGSVDDFFSDSIIISSGASNKFHNDHRRKTHITTCTSWFKGVDINPHQLEMFFDKKLSPHYGWLFPESDDKCNIGLCVLKKNIRGESILDVYSDFLNRHLGSRLKEAIQLESPLVHPILPSWKVKNNAIEGTLLTGDAGRFINAYTGEGISYALISGKNAVKAIHYGKRNNLNWAQTSKWYEKQLKKEFGIKMKFGYSMLYTGPVLLKSSEILVNIPVLKPVVTKMMSKL